MGGTPNVTPSRKARVKTLPPVPATTTTASEVKDVVVISDESGSFKYASEATAEAC